MAQFTTDINHLSPSGGEFLELADGAWQFRDYLAGIISAATYRPSVPSFISGLPCRVKLGKKKCGGSLALTRQDLPTAIIKWCCTSCGENGEISGWRCHLYDCTRYSDPRIVPGEKLLKIKLTSTEFEALLDSENIFSPDDLRVIYSGEKVGASIRLSGWESDMDIFNDSVAAVGNNTSNKKLEKALDSIFCKIQTALDDCFETSVLR